MAAKYSHQAVETEHLLAAMLEQSNGLARRILQKAEADPSAMLEQVDNHLRRLPKVSGHNDQVYETSSCHVSNKAVLLQSRGKEQGKHQMHMFGMS